uniref:Uncharacterized protein n=1 Tax=Anguilla anguilla TaxID=7936 RepID=A0A0E9WYY6_ANGAN
MQLGRGNRAANVLVGSQQRRENRKIKATRFAISEVLERIETLPGTTTVTDHSPDS